MTKFCLKCSAVMMLLQVFLFVAVSCSSSATEQGVLSAADVVNEIARRGDQVYAVGVRECNAAEVAAAELPDLASARTLVGQIRLQCDKAFRAVDRVREVIAAIDRTLVEIDAGSMALGDVTALALEARRRVDEAHAVHAEVAKYLATITAVPK
jgi:hypothetical protein